MRKFFILLLSIINFHSWSQSLPGAIDKFKLLNTRNELPPDLLSSRTAVYIQVPDKKGDHPVRGDWKKFAQSVHEGFRKIGIDAVAYYNFDDLNAGLDAEAGFINPLDNRQIENLIFLNEKETILGNEIILTITERTEGGLLQLNQPAYRLQRNTIGEIIAQLGRDIYADKLVNSNFLILDKPEFFTDTDVVKGRRNESFNRDLKISKLAVPLFSTFKFPDNLDSTTVSEDKLSMITQYNNLVASANQKLEGIMSTYPFKYELVDYSEGEDHLYRREFSYVLMYLHSTGKTIKELLNYDVDYNETAYITLKSIEEGMTTLEQFPANTPVFKFYMKQFVNKEIYLGNQWDADLTWEEALINHLNNFKETVLAKSN